MFDKICDLTDDKHFVIVNAYLKEGIIIYSYMHVQCVSGHVYGFDLFFIVEKSPDVCIGYLLMEYFPLGNINAIFSELTTLDKYTDDIQQIDKLKLNSQSNEEFGNYRIEWQKAMNMRDKITDCCKRLWRGIIDSLKHFHNQKLVHLDIKGIQLHIAICI